MRVAFDPDAESGLHRLTLWMSDAEACVVLGALESIAKVMRNGESPPSAPVVAPTSPRGPETREELMALGYTGDACDTCGQFMMTRSGTCLKCESCGATSGCS